MVLQAVSRKMFDELHHHRTGPLWPHEEVEWFVERTRTLIGSISRNMNSGNWVFVIEGRDERGRFYELESRDGILSQAEARAELEKELNRVLATGLKVFSSITRNLL